MVEPKKIENTILERFHLSIAREAEKEEELRAGRRKEKKTSVTSLVYECRRKAYYDMTFPEVLIDPAGAIRVWVGRKCHETPILGGEMELELEWEGIVGRVDEYGDGVVLDKKTTRRTPRDVYPHHIKQLEFYKVLLEESGRRVDIGAIVYINVDSTEIKIFPVEFLRGSDEIKREMLEKRKEILDCTKSGILPPRKIMTWDEKTTTLVCQYCNYFGFCTREDGTDPRWKYEEKIPGKRKEDVSGIVNYPQLSQGLPASTTEHAQRPPEGDFPPLKLKNYLIEHSVIERDPLAIGGIVKSSSNPSVWYSTFVGVDGFTCSCKDQSVHKGFCKHIIALIYDCYFKGEINSDQMNTLLRR